MFSNLIQNDLPQKKEAPKEGDLYKVVNTFGKTFELRYGYYEECDRNNSLIENPIPIYPDFVREPIYTDGGEPFVTMMQDACKSYKGNTRRTVDTTCEECIYFQRGEDWFGLCKCKQRRKND